MATMEELNRIIHDLEVRQLKLTAEIKYLKANLKKITKQNKERLIKRTIEVDAELNQVGRSYKQLQGKLNRLASEKGEEKT